MRNRSALTGTYDKLASKHPGTGTDVWIDELIRPEFISNFYGRDVVDVSVAPLDATLMMPAGGCYRYICQDGTGFGMGTLASR